MSFNKRFDPALDDFLKRQSAAAPAVGLGPNVGALASAPAPAAFSPQAIAAPMPAPPPMAVMPPPSAVMAGLAQTIGLPAPQQGFGDLLGGGQPRPGRQAPQQPQPINVQPIQRENRKFFDTPPGTVTHQDMNYLLDLEAQVGGMPGGARSSGGEGRLGAFGNSSISPDRFLRNEQVRIGAQANRERDDVNARTNLPYQIRDNQTRINEINAQIEQIHAQQDTLDQNWVPEDIESVYNAQTNQTIWFHRNGGYQVASAEGDHTGQPPPVQAPGAQMQADEAALVAERDQLEEQIKLWNARLNIASGDTYQGRGEGFVDGKIGTAMNTAEALRETVITEYGDAMANWLQTGDTSGTIVVLNALNAKYFKPQGASGFLIDNIQPFFEFATSLASNFLSNNTGEMTPEEREEALANEFINGESSGAWMYQWLQEHPELHDEALRVYYAGYDTPTVDTDGDGVPDQGDGLIDYTGGRALWEWYIGQQPWHTSVLSQILLDPLNLTMGAGFAGKGLRAASYAATIAGDMRKASLLGKAATAMEFLSSIDDPIWWVQAVPLKGGAWAGRKVGIIKNAIGEEITLAERTAANAAMTDGNPQPLMDLAGLTIDQVPVHAATDFNGQTVMQVGNSGSVFVGQNPDGTWTVYSRNNSDNLIAEEQFGDQADALNQARQDELTNIGTLYASGQEGQALAYDNPIPIIYDNKNGVAYVGAGQEIRVVYNDQAGTYTVQVHTGGGNYSALPDTYSDPDSAMQAAEQNYLGTTGSDTTGGGVPVVQPSPSTPMTGRSRFGRTRASGPPTPQGPTQQPLVPSGQPPAGVAPDGSVGPGGAGSAPSLTTPQSGDVSVGGLAFRDGGTIVAGDGAKLQVWDVDVPGGGYTVSHADDGAWEVWETVSPDGMPLPANQQVRIDTPGQVNSLDDAAALINAQQPAPGSPIGAGAVPGQGGVGDAPASTAADANLGTVTPAPDPTITPGVGAAPDPIGGAPAGEAVSETPPTGASAEAGPVRPIGPAGPSHGSQAWIDEGEAAYERFLREGGGQNSPPPPTDAAVDAGDVIRAGDGAVDNVAVDAEQAAQDQFNKVDDIGPGRGPQKDFENAEVNLASEGAPSPAAAAADAAPTGAGAVPGGSAAPGAGAAPTGPATRPGMYYRSMSPASGGPQVVDIPPHEAWIRGAADVIGAGRNDGVDYFPRIEAWAAENPRIQQARAVFDAASRSGDEAEQAFASLEMQATMMEEWAASPGLQDVYGPIRPQTSPGALGDTAKSAEFGEREWARDGRTLERVATGRGGLYDESNLQLSGLLPGGERRLVEQFLSKGDFPRWVGRVEVTNDRFIRPDGVRRLTESEWRAMSPDQKSLLNAQLLDPSTRRKAYENERRLDEIRDRMRQAQLGRPRQDEIKPPDTTKPKRPKAEPRPGADTKDVKANAQAMAPEQEALIPGDRFAGWDAFARDDGLVDVAPFVEGYTPFGQFLDLSSEDDFALGWNVFLRNADRTARYDIVRIRTKSQVYSYSLMDQNGWLWGHFSKKGDLLKAVSEVDASGGGGFLRVFDNKDGRLAVVARGDRKPAKIAADINQKHFGATTIKVVQDQDGVYHLVLLNSDGERLAVYNNYTTLGAAQDDAIAVKRTGKAGVDLELRNADDSPIVPSGRGEGGATFATVPGVPQLSQKFQNALAAARSTKPAVPNPKNDGTFAGRLFDDGAIDEEVYDVLNQRYSIVDKKGNVVRDNILVQDEILDRMFKHGNFDRAFNEVIDEWQAFKTPSLPRRSIGGKVWSSINEQTRANALYGIHRIFAGMAGDMINNAYTSILSGYGVTVARSGMGPRDLVRSYQWMANGNWDHADETLLIFQKAKQNGVALRVDDIGDVSRWDVPTKGDMPASQLLQRIGVPQAVSNALVLPIQSRGARNVRNWQDFVDRAGLSTVEYDRQLLKARAEMTEVVRDEALRLGKDATEWHQKFVSLGDDVNVDELAKLFDNNRAINRAWKQKTLQIRDGVTDAVRKYKFVGGRTNIDEFVSHFLFFHYWNSRSVALHAEIASKNPLLINLYLSAYEDGRQRAEEGNLPTWLNGWVRFMGDPEGWMGFFNPIGMLVPMFMFAEMGGEEWGDLSLKDQILSLGAFSPWVLAGLTVAGQMGRMPDLTYTSGWRNFARAVINAARAEGIGPIDQFMSPVGDPVDTIMDDALNWLSRVIGEEYLGGTEVQQTDPRASDLRLLNLMVDQHMENLYGPDWRDNPALVEYANEAKAAMETGQGHNAVSEQVYKNWTRDKFLQSAIRVAVPGQAQFVYGPQNENWAETQAIWDKSNAGMTLTPEEQATLDANSANSQTADARNINAQMDGYYDIGTKFQRDLNMVRTRLLYDDVPEGLYVIINQNEYYTAEEWNAMSLDDRRESVWRWVANQGGTDQLNLYYQARDAYLEQNPELRGYIQWKDAFLQDPEVLHAEMMRRSPEYAAYIESLDDPNDQSKWMTIRAYYASIGEQYYLNENVSSPLDPNPLNTITGYLHQPMSDEYVPPASSDDDEEEGYGSGNWRTMNEFQQNAPAEFIEYQQGIYQQQIADAQPIVDDVLEEGGWGWMAGMTYAEIEATAQERGTSKAYDDALAAIKNELYRLDVKVPSKNGEIKDYERWRDQRLASDPGADVSLEAFEREKLERQAKYGVGPFAAPTPQQEVESYNQSVADWWNANPNATMFGRPDSRLGVFGDYVPPPELWWLER